MTADRRSSDTRVAGAGGVDYSGGLDGPPPFRRYFRGPGEEQKRLRVLATQRAAEGVELRDPHDLLDALSTGGPVPVRINLRTSSGSCRPQRNDRRRWRLLAETLLVLAS